MTRRRPCHLSRVLLLALLALLLPACANQGYVPAGDDAYGFLERAREEQQGPLHLRAALPTAAEVQAIHGLDLHAQGVQPLWLEIRNDSDEPVWAAHWSIDRDYFSPAEVAYTNRRGFSEEGYASLERWLLESALPRRIPPGETRSGFVYTNLTPGTKGFNLDVFSPSDAFNFTMLIDVPGFTPDYRLVDFENIYTPEQTIDVDPRALDDFLASSLPCCATGPDAQSRGLPLNLVFIGTGRALRRSLMRGQWLETRAEEKEDIAAELHHFDGRVADGRFFIERADGDSRLILDIWLSPWRVEGLPIWVAQTYFREVDSPIVAALRRSTAASERSTLLSRFIGEAISADLDSAQQFVVLNFGYNQSVAKLGFTPGIGRYSVDNPGTSFDGLGYFTQGMRGILFVSEEPVALGDMELLFFSATADASNEEIATR